MAKRFPRTFSMPLHSGTFESPSKQGRKGRAGHPLPLEVQAKLARKSLVLDPSLPSGLCDVCGRGYPLTFMRRIEAGWMRPEKLVCLLDRDQAVQEARNVDDNRTGVHEESILTKLSEDWWITHDTSPERYGLLRARRSNRVSRKARGNK